MASGKTSTRLGGVAVCALALAAGWAFFAESIAPLRQRESDVRREVADLKGRIEGAQKTIAEIQAQERDAARLRGEVERLAHDLPAGSAMTWLPALVKDHFARSGIAVPLIRLNTTQEVPNVPGYERGFWSVALPVAEVDGSVQTLLHAVADLDHQNAFVRVLDFAIRPDPENPAGRVGLLNVAALIRKEAATSSAPLDAGH